MARFRNRDSIFDKLYGVLNKNQSSLPSVTIPQLKKKCREYGIPFLHNWKKADFIAALRPTEFVQKWIPQQTFSSKYLICTQCWLTQPYAIDCNGNALCFACSIKLDVEFRKLTEQESAEMDAYYNLFWRNKILEFKNTNQCVVPLKHTDWFSISAPLNKILEKHLRDVRDSYEYEYDDTFSQDYRDYSIVNGSFQPDFDQTLGDLLTTIYGDVCFPEIPSLLSMSQNIVRKYCDRRMLLKHNILPTSLLKDL